MSRDASIKRAFAYDERLSIRSNPEPEIAEDLLP